MSETLMDLWVVLGASRTSGRSGRVVTLSSFLNLLLGLPSFFATGSGQGVLEALDVPPGRQGEAVHSPQHQHQWHHKLAGSLTALTVTTRCDHLPACKALY